MVNAVRRLWSIVTTLGPTARISGSVRNARQRKLSCRPMLEILEGRELPAVFVWDGGAGLEDVFASSAANWRDELGQDGLPGSQDVIRFDHTSAKDCFIDPAFLASVAAIDVTASYVGTITLGRDFSLTGVSYAQPVNSIQAGGIIDGSYNLTIETGTFTMSDATMAETGQTTVSASASYVFAGGGINKINGRVMHLLANSSNQWTNGNIEFSNGGMINVWANATFAVMCDKDMTVTTGGTFNNYGTFVKAGGEGITTIHVNFNHRKQAPLASIVQVNVGILDFRGALGQHSSVFHAATDCKIIFTNGTHELLTGTVFQGGGKHELIQGKFLIGANQSAQNLGNFALYSEIQGSGQGQNAGLFANSSKTTWYGGKLDYVKFLNAAGAELVIDGPEDKSIDRSLLTNKGTVKWEDGHIVFYSAGLNLENQAKVQNYGTWEVSSFTRMMIGSGQNDSLPQFINQPDPDTNNGGLFKKTGGMGNVIEIGFYNEGTVDRNGFMIVFDFYDGDPAIN